MVYTSEYNRAECAHCQCSYFMESQHDNRGRESLPHSCPSGEQHAFASHRIHWFPLRFPHRPRAALVVYMIRYALIPATLALATALAGQASPFNGKPVEAQYGPPIRYPDPRDWGPEERERRLPPPRSGYPIVRDPCIAYGQCGSRRPRMPPFPDRYDLYEDEQ